MKTLKKNKIIKKRIKKIQDRNNNRKSVKNISQIASMKYFG